MSASIHANFCFLKALVHYISVYRHQLLNVQLTSEWWFKAALLVLLWYPFESNVCSVNIHELWICMCQWCERERQVMGFKTGWMLMVWMNNLKPGAVLVYTHTLTLLSFPLLFVLCRPTLVMKWGMNFFPSSQNPPCVLSLFNLIDLTHTLFISLSQKVIFLKFH